MFKKLLLAGVFVVLFSGAVFGQTAQEILDIAISKQKLLNYAEAIKDYNQVIVSSDVTDNIKAQAYLGLSQCYERQEKWNDALLQYQNVFAFCPTASNHLKANAQMAIGYLYLDKFHNKVKAKEEFQKTPQYKSDYFNKRIYEELGDIYREEGDAEPLPANMKTKYYQAIRSYLLCKQAYTKLGIEKHKVEIKNLNNKIIDVKKTIVSLELEQ